MSLSKLDAFQIIKTVFDDAAAAISVKITDTALGIELSAGDGDSVTAFEGIEPKAEYDQILYTYPDTVTVVKTYKAVGSTVGVVTIVHTDATLTKKVSETRS
jgi:hypothetical protein